VTGGIAGVWLLVVVGAGPPLCPVGEVERPRAEVELARGVRIVARPRNEAGSGPGEALDTPRDACFVPRPLVEDSP